MNVQEAVTLIKAELTELYGSSEAHHIAYIMAEHFWGLSRSQLYLSFDVQLPKSKEASFTDALNQLKRYRPIQYVLNETEFYGLPFYVDERVLIPRPETEELVAWVLADEKHSPSHILDIGTGSGCIAITLAKHLPKAKVTAIDISREAIEVAKKNANLNSLAVNFLNEDILVPSPQLLINQIDCIVSNPPYVKNSEKALMLPNVLNYEPSAALFVPDNNPLLFYKAIVSFAENQLTKGGRLYFEINEALGLATSRLFNSNIWTNVELRKDLNGRDRMIKACKL